MPQDFSGQNLNGRSFKGLDLTGANFSHSDIRGANFTNAILRGANFTDAKAGLQHYWVINLAIALLILSALSGTVTVLTAWFAGNTLIAAKMPEFLASLIILLALAAMYFITIRLGLQAAALTTLLLAVLGILTYVCGNYVWKIISSEYWLKESDRVATPINWPVRVAIAIAWTTAGISFETVFSALFGVAFNAVFGKAFSSVFGAVFAVGTTIPSLVVLETVVKISEGSKFRLLSLLVVGAWLGGNIGWQALVTEEKYLFIRKIAIAFASIGGTNFNTADLTNAIFTQATLKNTDFRNANLTLTNFHLAKNLDRARVGNTILMNAKVRDLLVSKKGQNKSYAGCNLKGANLANADLSYANLTEVDVSEGTFFQANLEGANLTKIQALKTNFQQARMTAACLEAWNIDSNTQLQGAVCDYVYLLNNQQERRPSSGKFAPGEFTKIFQKALHTVDLILRNGLNKAAEHSFQQLKIENEGTELSIRSVEDIGDGVVLVRVNVPITANKEKIHAEFTQYYERAFKAIEERYQAELQSQQRQTQEWREISHALASRPINFSVNIPEINAGTSRQSLSGKSVILNLGDGNFESGFPSITAQICEGGKIKTQCMGELLPAPEIPKLYNCCISMYKGLILHPRIKPKLNQIVNFSQKDIYPLAEELKQLLNQWLNSDKFRPINNILREKIISSDEVPLIIQSENLAVRQLPWHLWDFFKSYRKAEVALSVPFYDRVEETAPNRAKKRILVILGDSTGINIEEDKKVFENLPGAETEFLVEPNRQQLDKQLWDEKGWDILCFSGHSSSQWDRRNGCININKTDALKLDYLENALRFAIERGLQLAIFNSCDGLGLATHLASLHIPQIIVMRELVPDLVAQEFLKNFLGAFASGESFYVAVRQAREKLQGLENNFPCATWLPVICQNPAQMPVW